MGEEIKIVHTDEIRPDPDQPRVIFDEDKIRQLAETYKSHGVINPVEVDENNIIILGERRWRAAKLAELDVPIRVKAGLTASERLERQLIDDAHREDLDSVERAWAYGTAVININTDKNYSINEVKKMDWSRLISLLGANGAKTAAHIPHGTAELARRLGMNQMTISNYVQILYLEPKTREHIVSGDVPYTYARVVARLSGNVEAKKKIEAMLREDAQKDKGHKRFRTREDLEAAVSLLLVKEDEEEAVIEQKARIFKGVTEGKIKASNIEEIKKIAQVSDKLADSVIEGTVELKRATESAKMMDEVSEMFGVTEQQKDTFVRKLQEDEEMLEGYKESVLSQVKKSMSATPEERALPQQPVGRVSPVESISNVLNQIRTKFKIYIGNCDVHERRRALKVLKEIKSEVESLITLLTED